MAFYDYQLSAVEFAKLKDKMKWGYKRCHLIHYRNLDYLLCRYERKVGVRW